LVVRQVCLRQPLRRTRRVSLRNPFRVLPAERRERDDARVEPDVADIRDASDLFPARLAADWNVVDPGTVQLLELVETGCRPLLELGPRADHVHVTATAGVDREG